MSEVLAAKWACERRHPAKGRLCDDCMAGARFWAQAFAAVGMVDMKKVSAEYPDNSPAAQLVRELDVAVGALLKQPSDKQAKGRAQGIATALAVISCLSEDEVREYAMYRQDCLKRKQEPVGIYGWDKS